MSKPHSAFTLIELVITVLIVSILTAVAAPKFREFYNQQRVETAALRVKADLELARETAIAKSKTQTVVFKPALNTYELVGADDLDRNSALYSVDLSTEPYEVNLSSNSMGVSQTLQFDMYGEPNNGGTVTLTSDGNVQTVTLESDTGKVTIP